jgi:hypothetical protein
MRALFYILAGLAAWEGGWWLARRADRAQKYAAALARARLLQRPLVVVGAPDAMITGGYGCGDMTVDLVTSTCPRPVQADITRGHSIPLGDNSAVVYVACTLEYVADFNAAVAELRRVAGTDANIFVTRVEPWTFTAWLFPGAKRVLDSSGLRSFSATTVT